MNYDIIIKAMIGITLAVIALVANKLCAEEPAAPLKEITLADGVVMVVGKTYHFHYTDSKGVPSDRTGKVTSISKTKAGNFVVRLTTASGYMTARVDRIENCRLAEEKPAK